MTEHVGTLAEEAARLLAVVQGWTDDHREHQAAQEAAVATEGVDAGSEDDTSAGHGETHVSGECRYCPLCNAVRLAKAVSPEVKEHLATAGMSTLMALKALLENIQPDPNERAQPVEKIDLSED